jgi:anti-anti-sigma factor
MEELGITIENGDGAVPTIILRGELDSSNAAQLERQVEQALSRHPPALVFDLAELRFMDSAGIAVFVAASARVERVALRDPSPILRRVLAATGLTGILHIEP